MVDVDNFFKRSTLLRSRFFTRKETNNPSCEYMINTSMMPSSLPFISGSSQSPLPAVSMNNQQQQQQPHTGSVSFKVHIHTVQIKLMSDMVSVTPESMQLSVNFANFKQFMKQPLSIIHENNNPSSLPQNITTTTATGMTVLDWEFDRQFLYETRAIQFMHLKHLTIQLHSINSNNNNNNNDNNDSNSNKMTNILNVGEVKTDLYTLACGPTHHELELIDQNENRKIGTISYHLTMEQVSEVQLCVRSISISVNAPIECYLIYKHSGRNAKTYRTDISHNIVSPFWQNLEPLWLTGTLKDLVRQSIFIQVVQKIQQQFVTVAKCHIPLFRVISLINNQTVPFNGNILFNEMVRGTFNCLVESRNVPVFAQLIHGKHVGYGIVGGSVFFPGVKVPTIPQFPNDLVAQQYYLQKKQKDILDKQQNQVPSFDPEQFRMGNEEESTTTNRELSQLLSQSNALKLSNDRLSVKYDNSQTISVPSCVKSSSCIFDLNDQYFEVTILDSGVRDFITVGLSSQSFAYHTQPGSNDASYGFESKSGNKLHSGQTNLYSSPFTVGDTVGCGISPEGAIYFTRNSQFLGVAYYPITSKITNKDLFCTVALHSHHARVRVNFGHEKFKFNLENAKLPSGWKLHDSVDRFGRFFFISADNNRTFVDPRLNPTIWKEQNETAERLCNTLMKPLLIKFSDQGNLEKLDKVVKWTGIKSERVINALRVIPRSAFVPEELVATANIGQHMSADINDIPFDLTSTMVIARALDVLKLEPGSKFLEIGSGCGYMTTLAGFIVGDEGVACGIDINERIVEFSRNKLLEFITQTGLSLQSITFTKRNLFQSSTHPKLRKGDYLPSKAVLTPPVISTLSVSAADEYDAIFCGLEVQRSQFNDFRSLLKTGGSVVTCVDNTLVRLWLNKNLDWEEESIMKLPNESISQVILPTEMERRLEKIDALKEGLLQMGYNLDNIQAAMTYLGYTIHSTPDFDFDDANRQLTLLNYCHLAQHPNLSRFKFSPEEIIDAIESFPTPFQATASTEALIYLSNTRNFSAMYQIPTKKVKEVFQVMHCNLESIQRLLSDAKYCMQQLQKYKTGSSAVTEHEMIREIFQDLIAFNNVDTALAHLVKKYSIHQSAEQ